MERSLEEQLLIESSFSQFYVMNSRNDSFLIRVNHHVKLNTYHCYCYGNTETGVRSVHAFQFVNIHPHGYDIYIEKEEKVVFVRDLITLRRDYFHFVDRTSLFRSSFLYDSIENKLFRLHYLHLFLYLPSCDNGACWVGLIRLEKKKQILSKVRSQYQKIQKSILGSHCCEYIASK